MSGDEAAVDVVHAERSVVGALLLNGALVRRVTPTLAPTDFLDQSLGELYAGMKRLVAEGVPVDQITVADRLADWQVRGLDVAAVFALASEVPTAENVEHYAAQVREAAVRRQLTALGSRIASSAGRMPSGVVLAKAAEGLQAIRSSSQRSQALAVRLEDVMAGTDEYEWVIPGLLEHRDRLMITGIEGGGKSMLIRQMCLLAAAGIHPFGFRAIEPVRVLVIDAENSEAQWRRSSRALLQAAALHGRTNPTQNTRIWCAPRIDLTTDAGLSEVHGLIDQHRPDLLAIGPLYRLTPRAINTDDDASPLLAALDTLRDRGPALLIEAHAGHATSGNSGDRDLRPRGSAALLGWPEFGLGIAAHKVQGKVSGSKFELRRWRGDRDARDWPSHIARGASVWPWTPQNGVTR